MTLKSFKQAAFSESKRGRVLAFIGWFILITLLSYFINFFFEGRNLTIGQILWAGLIALIYTIPLKGGCLITRMFFPFQPTEKELTSYYEEKAQDLEFCILMAEDDFMEDKYKAELTEHNSLYTALKIIKQNS